jgi:hypothetical protein
MKHSARLAVPLAFAAIAALAAPAAAGARMSILYDEQDAVRALTDPSGPGAPITAERGAFRQDPGAGGIFDPRGRDDAYRLGKLAGAEIEGLSPEAMADRIQDEIDDPEHPNSSGLVAIDEIGNRFNDGRVRITRTTKTVRGTRIRISSANRLVITKNGYRIERRPAALPVISPASPGAKLSVAMEILAGRPYPGGGSYAERVHMYISPAFGSSIALGRGPHHHLGNDGLPHRATWRGVMPAIARAGGVWIEMYHPDGAGGVSAMSAREWRIVPDVFASYTQRFGTYRSRIHLTMSAIPVAPAGAVGCGDPMGCQWGLAASTPTGAELLANGPGTYRLGSQATAWRTEFNRVFGGS